MPSIIAARSFSTEPKRAKKHGQLFGADRVECVLRITGDLRSMLDDGTRNYTVNMKPKKRRS